MSENSDRPRMSGNNGCPNDENDYEIGVREERARIVARLRARATSEDLTADRWAQGGDDRMTALHRKAAEVLREEASALESDRPGRGSPYRTPSCVKPWRPQVGGRVVIAESKWSIGYGHAGRVGTLVAVRGAQYEVRCGEQLLYVCLCELAPGPPAGR